MRKRKIISSIVFVVIAMASGGIVSAYKMDQKPVEVKGAEQEAKTMFSCEFPGCTETEIHRHGLCGIEGCMQIGEHSHSQCSIAECTETGVHMHNGEYCYPHSADDGHAYHTCGVSGCTEAESHTHNSCGVEGCMQTGEHIHRENHHQSGHKGRHH